MAADAYLLSFSAFGPTLLGVTMSGKWENVSWTECQGEFLASAEVLG